MLANGHLCANTCLNKTEKYKPEIIIQKIQHKTTNEHLNENNKHEHKYKVETEQRNIFSSNGIPNTPQHTRFTNKCLVNGPSNPKGASFYLRKKLQRDKCSSLYSIL